MTTRSRSRSPKRQPARIGPSWRTWGPFYSAGVVTSLTLTSSPVEISPVFAVLVPIGVAWLYVARPWQRLLRRRPGRPSRSFVQRPVGRSGGSGGASTRTAAAMGSRGSQKPSLRVVDRSDPEFVQTLPERGEPTVLAALLSEFRDLINVEPDRRI